MPGEGGMFLALCALKVAESHQSLVLWLSHEVEVPGDQDRPVQSSGEGIPLSARVYVCLLKAA